MSNLRGFNVMYDIEPIVIQQVKRIAAHLYTKDAAKAEEGSRRLENALLTPLKEKSGSAKPENAKRDVENVKGYAFEVALFNALATLGIPVLFGGSSEVGGPSTPGYDLVALNLTRQEPFGPLAICISTKCSPNQPFESDIQKLLSGIEALEEDPELEDFSFFGVIASPITKATDLLTRDRPDVKVWLRTELEFIFKANVAEDISGLLWNPPSTPKDLTDLHYLGMHAQSTAYLQKQRDRKVNNDEN